jgi:hypothetical protein
MTFGTERPGSITSHVDAASGRTERKATVEIDGVPTRLHLHARCPVPPEARPAFRRRPLDVARPGAAPLSTSPIPPVLNILNI